MQPEAIFTIGYAGTSIAAFIRTLRQAGIALVLDIRAVPVSRKKGFSKHQLAAHLSEAGIGYRHLRGLGTPKRGRDAAKAGDLASFERIFLEHMGEPEALLDLGEAVGPRGSTARLPALPGARARALPPVDRGEPHGRANPSGPPQFVRGPARSVSRPSTWDMPPAGFAAGQLGPSSRRQPDSVSQSTPHRRVPTVPTTFRP